MAQVLFGYELKGEVRLRRARTGRGTLGLLHVEGAQELQRHQGELVCEVETPEARVALTRTGAGLLVSCSLTGNYLVEPDQRRVRFDGPPGDDAWEHRLVSTILPLLLAERGELALHASAVVGPAGAILFCGPSGRGKSTVAAALAARGYAVLADDATVITDVARTPRVWAGPAGVVVGGHVLAKLGANRLDFEREEMGDQRCRAVHFIARAGDAPELARVCAVVLLAERGTDVEDLQILEPVAAVPALVSSAVYVELSQVGNVMHSIARLVEGVPVYRVQLADQLRLASEQAEAVLAGVSEARGSEADDGLPVDPRQQSSSVPLPRRTGGRAP